VESQWLESKDHFDSGTTSTLIQQWDPDTNKSASPGIIPISDKPPRTETKQVIEDHSSLLLPSPTDIKSLMECTLWQLKQIALEHKPELEHLKKSLPPCLTIDPIAPHITEQYPLPAMHIDKSSIDGTINVYEAILKELGITNENVAEHGVMFTDGDLLTDSLIDKARSLIPLMQSFNCG
jgi:hypothetical protein